MAGIGEEDTQPPQSFYERDRIIWQPWIDLVRKNQEYKQEYYPNQPEKWQEQLQYDLEHVIETVAAYYYRVDMRERE